MGGSARSTPPEPSGFEELLCAVGATFVGVSADEVDTVVHDALQRVGELVGAALACIVITVGNRRMVHQWLRPGAPASLLEIATFGNDEVPWVAGRMRKAVDVQIYTVDSLPPEADLDRRTFTRYGIKGFMILPLRTREGIAGAVALHWLNEGNQWQLAPPNLLRMLGQLVAIVVRRAQAEREMQHSAVRLRSFIEQSGDSIFCYEVAEGIPADLPLRERMIEFGKNARLVECNELYAASVGARSRLEILGRTSQELNRATPEEMYESFRHFVDNNPKGVQELVKVLPDGSKCYMLGRTYPFYENGYLVRIWGSFRDVTSERREQEERVALQAQLHHAQKLESMGLLAGGMAHDFNNMLVVILTSCDLAQAAIEDDPGYVREALEQVRGAGERAAALTRQLLAFSRNQPIQRRPIEVNRVVEDVRTMLRRLIRESITMDIVLGPDAGVAFADPGQLEQVLINLCVNASDAIGDVGRIMLRTRAFVPDAAFRATHAGAAGVYAEIAVHDSGSGMSHEVRSRIFEPFFTTKERGRGTGLGLSVAFGIVQQHEGFIDVDSREGEGTTFRVYLPTATTKASTAETDPRAPVRGGSEHILVAEDDESVRKLVERVLRSAGYVVWPAADGDEAVRLFDDHAESVDLVLLDAVMPQKSGQAVLEHIMQRRPDVSFLFTSGYAAAPFSPSSTLRREDVVLPKPYDVSTLLSRVRRLLDNRA